MVRLTLDGCLQSARWRGRSAGSHGSDQVWGMLADKILPGPRSVWVRGCPCRALVSICCAGVHWRISEKRDLRKQVCQRIGLPAAPPRELLGG